MNTSRRTFLHTTAAATASLPLAGSRVLAANAKLQHASIGVMGMGKNDLHNIASHPSVEIVALCDVDAAHLAQAATLYPEARLYRDYRELIAKEGDAIDSINVAIPDHMHAPVAKLAMEKAKHVYCQKPLTHDVAEARMLTELADSSGVITQMGNQIHSHIAYRMAVSWIQSGAIGKIKEVHSWVAASYPHAPRVDGADPIPEGVNWDHWLGVAPTRPYKESLYHPFEWRRWQDFGTGAMGDFGCHILDPVHTALKLLPPTNVHCTGVEQAWLDDASRFKDSWPSWGIVEYEFPGTEYTTDDTLKLTWYDGDKKPPKELANLPEGQELSRSGSLFMGEEGVMMLPHVGGPRMYPQEKYQGYAKPDIPEVVDHYHTWIDHVLAGKRTSDGFHYAGPLTEAVLLGTIGHRLVGQSFNWDAAAMQSPNTPEVNALLQREWRSFE